MDQMFKELKKMVCEDMREVISKGTLAPCDYGPIGDAIDIYKDVMEIQKMEMELGMSDEGSEMWEDSSRMSGVPARSPRTGRYISRADGQNTSMMSNGEWEAYGSTYPYTREPMPSFHDKDGSINRDIDELMNTAKSDHERMLLMRIKSKITEQK